MATLTIIDTRDYPIAGPVTSALLGTLIVYKDEHNSVHITTINKRHPSTADVDAAVRNDYTSKAVHAGRKIQLAK